MGTGWSEGVWTVRHSAMRGGSGIVNGLRGGGESLPHLTSFMEFPRRALNDHAVILHDTNAGTENYGNEIEATGSILPTHGGCTIYRASTNPTRGR
jgi:hypothetical protein